VRPSQSQMAVPPCESYVSAVSPVAWITEVYQGCASHDSESGTLSAVSLSAASLTRTITPGG